MIRDRKINQYLLASAQRVYDKEAEYWKFVKEPSTVAYQQQIEKAEELKRQFDAQVKEFSEDIRLAERFSYKSVYYDIREEILYNPKQISWAKVVEQIKSVNST